MLAKRRFLVLIAIMAFVVLVMTLLTTYLLYRTSLDEQEERLVETARSRARLIEAVAHFDRNESTDYPGGWENATLSQVIEAHENFKGFGKTGEFTMAFRNGDEIDFILSHRHGETEEPEPVPFKGANAEPMRRALSGGSGTMVGRDYRGVEVLAAYEPVTGFNATLGIVAKIDMQEVREPFLKVVYISIGVALLLVLGGALLFLRISNPMIIQMEELQRQQELILNAAGEGIYGLDLEGNTTLINPSAAKMIGWEPEELLGKKQHSVLHHTRANGRPYPKEECPILAVYQDGKVQHRDNEIFWRKDGSSFPVEYTSTPIRDERGALTGAVVTFSDITARRRAEEQLANYARELERSNTELERFAFISSHDLQEPLRMVSSYVQLLEKRYRDQLDDQANEFIDFAVQGTHRMQQKINDLLAYSRVETQDRELESVDFEAILQRVLETLDMIIKEDGAKITHDRLPTTMADGSQIEQVFQNLIGNALKFHGDRTPEIHIGVTKEKSRWVFSVADNGIGLNPKYADKIFVIFQRLHGGDTYAGTGIGLAICKKIIERHGGRVWLESKPGEGSTFYFSIPFDGGKQ